MWDGNLCQICNPVFYLAEQFIGNGVRHFFLDEHALSTDGGVSIENIFGSLLGLLIRDVLVSLDSKLLKQEPGLCNPTLVPYSLATQKAVPRITDQRHLAGSEMQTLWPHPRPAA